MTNWLQGFERKMRIQKRKILLFLDNAASYPKNSRLENIKIVYLPPNTTSVCHPLDQGIIRNLTCFYRSIVLKTIVYRIQDAESVFKVFGKVMCYEKCFASSTQIADVFSQCNYTFHVYFEMTEASSALSYLLFAFLLFQGRKYFIH